MFEVDKGEIGIKVGRLWTREIWMDFGKSDIY
jgi:hypothetical protein